MRRDLIRGADRANPVLGLSQNRILQENSLSLSAPSRLLKTLALTARIATPAYVLSLSACAGSGSINWDQARQLKVGMTEAELVRTLGQPYSVVSKSDGTQMWIWVNVVAFGGAEHLSVAMKDGKATQVPVIPATFK